MPSQFFVETSPSNSASPIPFPSSLPMSKEGSQGQRASLSRDSESKSNLMLPPQISPQRHPITISSPASVLSNPSSIYSSPSYSPFSPTNSFNFYPGSLPANPHLNHQTNNNNNNSFFQPRQGSQDSPPWQTSTEDEAGASGLDLEMELNFDDDLDFSIVEPTLTEIESDAAPASAVKRSLLNRTPRPPNAWILYRSDKLKAIAAGEALPSQEQLLVEAGISSGTASASASSEDDNSMLNDSRKGKNSKGKASVGSTETPLTSNVSSPNDEELAKLGKLDKSMAPPPTIPMKKGKKGSKDPTEGYLSLGRGKTGRGLPQADISKMISIAWKRESPEVRRKYEQMSEMKKLEHLEKYPGYKFQPLRKADKIKLREERDREKEAIKREKAARGTTGRTRRNRQKVKVTPTSPYSTVSVDRIRPGAKMSRSLSQGYLSSQASGASPGSYQYDGRHSQGLATREDEDHRTYPFPMPPGSLPSMKPEDHADNPYTDGAETGDSFNSSMYPSRSTSPIKQYQDNYQAQGYADYTQRMWPLDEMTQGYPRPIYHDMPGMGPTYGVPFVMDPIPLPDGYDLEHLDPLPGMDGDADTLAAMWCVMEENTDMPLNSDEQNGLMKWDGDAHEAADQWSSLTTNLFSGFELSNTVAQSVMADWATHHPSQETQQGAYYQPTYDPSGSYLQMSYPSNPTLGPDSQTRTNNDANETRGPFLSTALPISPISWSSGTTPRETTFLRAQNGHNDRRVSINSNGSSNNLPTPRATSFGAAPPRHISNSAYMNDSRLSVDPARLSSGNQGNGHGHASMNNNGWNGNYDRHSSFAASNMVIPELSGDDVLDWGDEDASRTVSSTGTVRVISGSSDGLEVKSEPSTNSITSSTSSSKSTTTSKPAEASVINPNSQTQPIITQESAPAPPTPSTTTTTATPRKGKNTTTWVTTAKSTVPVIPTKLDPPPPPRGKGPPRTVGRKFESPTKIVG